MNDNVKVIMDKDEIARKLTRIATEIAQRNMTASKIALIGIVRRGVPLAQRLAEIIKPLTNAEVYVGSLDITLYGADHNLISRFPVLNGTEISFPLAGTTAILVDDIFYTGKTIHKAVNALLDIAEPEEIQLAVFLDRGRRTFPIGADYVGARVTSSSLERVAVHVEEVDGMDEVIMEKRGL